ncbi:unnamed protein product [Notodromas monacha]|uniref:alpha-1,2-Mannosidase n=1 Tax=Notodromas monacha TaxID=399045 RepID=A0A7R9BJ66_9CRUS|nr:unnamed protein product [Notodromas monacha]CAG0915612.1 unnamed protein product [Notodromas monacha]
MNIRRQQVVEMFYHAYDGYMKHGFPLDELRPLSCDGIDTWGSYSLTLIDALDTLAILGNHSEFRRVADLLISSRKNFEANINVSVFETNIRIVGGLISAHLFARRAGMDLDPGWPCKGPLLDLAVDIARRLLPAFDTPTGMPFGTINLAHGVPKGETPVTCTAGVGTYIVEFSALSRLTGDPIFEDVAMRAMNGLWSRRSSIGLFGNHIDVSTGKWTAIESGIGAGVDSYLEYMVKGGILRRDPVLLEMFDYARKPIRDYLEHGGWHFWGTMSRGAITMPVFQSLEAYWPGVLSLIGDIGSAMASLKNYRLVWKQFGFTPEFYSVPTQEVGSRHGYPLRPELAESVMYLYRATRDPFVLDMGVDILASIEHSAKTACGYATVKNVLTHQLEDRMESFFLAETVKYLYLLFTPDHWIHNPGGSGVRVSVESDFGDSRTCVVESGG